MRQLGTRAGVRVESIDGDEVSVGPRLGQEDVSSPMIALNDWRKSPLINRRVPRCHTLCDMVTIMISDVSFLSNTR